MELILEQSKGYLLDNFSCSKNVEWLGFAAMPIVSALIWIEDAL